MSEGKCTNFLLIYCLQWGPNTSERRRGKSLDVLGILQGKQLTSLDLRCTHKILVSDAHLALLRGMPLTSLHIADPSQKEGGLTNEGLEVLRGMPLTALTLSFEGRGKISNEGLAVLRGMALTDLCISGSELITDDMIGYLEGLPLVRLSLGDSNLTDVGLELLRGRPLKCLEIPGTQVTDTGLEHLYGMPLASLDLGRTQITGSGLVELAEHIPLCHLDVEEVENLDDWWVAKFWEARAKVLMTQSGGEWLDGSNWGTKSKFWGIRGPARG